VAPPMNRCWTILLLSFALAGCAPGGHGPPDTAEQAIVNGQQESGFPSVVAMGAEINDVAMSMCTGNLITPEIVLCAGHCGDDIPLELVIELGSAFFGTDIGNHDEMIGFSDFEVHPDYVPLQQGVGGSLGEYDLSVFVLDEPAQAEPTWFNREEITDGDLGLEMISVGFGTTGPQGYGSGVKRSAALTLDLYDEMFLVTYSSTNPNEANICSGDSGGPQFLEVEDGRPVQLAVHSWGDEDCESSGGSTRTDIAQDWILDWVEAVHGTRDVCEANGWYEDGFCDEMCDLEDPDCLPDEGDDDDTALEAEDADEDAEACDCTSSTAPGQFSMVAAWLLVAFSIRRGRG